MEAEDVLIKATETSLPLSQAEFHKASPDDPKHPGCQKEPRTDAAENFVRRMRPQSHRRSRTVFDALLYAARCEAAHSRYCGSLPRLRQTSYPLLGLPPM